VRQVFAEWYEIREFITVLGGAAAVWPPAARAAGRANARIGVLVNSVETDPAVQGRIAAFRQSLERLGCSKIPAMSRERGDRGDRMKRRQFITVIGRRASLDEQR
jgi:hypothetical protein